MLVLTRKTNEALYIGPDVKITIVKCLSGEVRLGIDAPQQVKVLRAELLERPTKITKEKP